MAVQDREPAPRRYRHVMAAVDLSRENREVAEQALAVARQDGARFSLAHVVADLFAEPSYELMTTLPVDLDLQAHVMESARTSLEQLAEAIGAGRDSVLVEVGVPRNTLVALAEERGVDLIVLGNHGVHGLERLLGSTATAVLRAAPCDVYAVKIGST